MKTTPHQRAHDLSQQVHRIGFHFPSVVVAQVCAYYGIVLTSAGTVLAEDESESFHPRSKRLKEQIIAQDRKDQITINTEARDTIKDLFPNIPDDAQSHSDPVPLDGQIAREPSMQELARWQPPYR